MPPTEQFSKGDEVWARLGASADFAAGRVAELTVDGVVVEVTATSEKHSLAKENVFRANPGAGDVSDLTALLALNEATMLDALRKRYSSSSIYTFAAEMLTCLNPYAPLPALYTEEARQRAKAADVHDPRLEPHLYVLAERAFRRLRADGRSQSLVVSGESGAGKTEANKICMEYLVWRTEADAADGGGGGGGGAAAGLTTRVLQANPVLEALGNAKTVRNDNSSRFGKFVNLRFDAKCAVAGAEVRTFLLEKSRVTNAEAAGERSYHVFYQMLAGAAAGACPPLAGKTAATFRLLSLGGGAGGVPYGTAPPRPGVDEEDEFGKLRFALGWVGLSDASQLGLWQTLAAILHLGNVTFRGVAGDVAAVDQDAEVRRAEELLGVTNLQDNLLEKVIVSPRSGAEYHLTLDAAHAAAARDSLLKQLYTRIFEHVVHAINDCLAGGAAGAAAAGRAVGLLDVFGFEHGATNSFEQLCINFANEKLQQFFLQQTFTNEISLYAREGLAKLKVDPPDNAEVCAFFDCGKGPRVGTFQLLDAQSKQPKATDAAFTQNVYSAHGGAAACFGSLDAHGGPPPELTAARLKPDEGFVVRHFAATVVYDTRGFLEKNDNKTNEPFLAKVRARRRTRRPLLSLPLHTPPSAALLPHSRRPDLTQAVSPSAVPPHSFASRSRRSSPRWRTPSRTTASTARRRSRSTCPSSRTRAASRRWARRSLPTSRV